MFPQRRACPRATCLPACDVSVLREGNARPTFTSSATFPSGLPSSHGLVCPESIDARMHERTERAIAQLLFVFCCALPTAFTLLCILVTWTPWYHRRQLQRVVEQLSTQSGLVVEIEDFERISPNQWSLQHVRLIEPETRCLVATVRQVDWIKEPDETRAVLRQPELQSSQLKYAWRLVHDRLICRPEHTLTPIRIEATRLSVRSKTGDVTMEDVEASVAPFQRGVRMMLTCLPVESFGQLLPNPSGTITRSTSRTTIELTRDRSGKRPTSTLVLHSGDNELNCSALADYIPLMRRLGPEATFRGTIQYTRDDEGWSVELAGSRLSRIDMSRLCEDLAYPIRGSGEIHFDRGWVSPGQSINVAGTLQMKHGWLGNQLLKSLQQDLGFVVEPSVIPTDGRDLHYDYAAIRFSANDASSLSLKGVCASDPQHRWAAPGTAVCDGGQAIVYTDTRSASAGELLAAIGAEPIQSPLWSQIMMTLPVRAANGDRGGTSKNVGTQIPSGRVLRAGPIQGEDVIFQR